MFVFAYGSLLHPPSLRRTLPDVDLAACVPARADGWTRRFTVGFPNDGSESDKAYHGDDGERPPTVLFCDLHAAPATTVNGVCIPVTDAELALLVARERRYDLVEVRAAAYDGAAIAGVAAFVGRDPYRRATGGAVPRSYVDDVVAGARHWDGVAPGFLDDFHASTRMPHPDDVVPLTRIDLR